ncbi:DUF3037 domain-containing protein [Amphritea sp. HPY]|uniref:DUF3037 domain-containing protein n=1 Tax=Amphritea sp. HPY TaxID=3421652 RepID=UPI003D7E0048
MKKYACQYNIIRFAPFIETEEFANIGIAIYCPSTGKMTYRITPTRFARVTQFFDGLEPKLYKNVILRLKHELENLERMLTEHPNSEIGTALFAETLRNKGSILRFSDVRVILTHDLDVKADDLYQHYVGRSFVTKKYREQDMVRNVRSCLKQLKLDGYYKQVRLNDGITDVSLPLVRVTEETPVSVIKPIAFDQNIRAKIVDHADLWLMKIGRLAKNGAVKPENLLVTLDQPITKDVKVRDYIKDFENELIHLGVNTVQFSNTKAIVNFAKSQESEKLTTTH